MTRGGVALALGLASLACTCGEVAPPSTDTDPPFADPADPLDPGVPRRGRKGGKVRPPLAPGDPAAPPAEPEKPGPVPGITYLGDDTWEVERQLVERYEDDPTRIGAKAREHGKGWEVFGVHPHDDANALGARNGDVIKRINGMSLDTTTDLLLVWAELGDATNLDVLLTRDGEDRVFHYHIVR